MKTRLFLFLSSFLAVVAHASAQQLQVVTLQTVLTEVAREVGGAQVNVVGLLQPGVDPHTFEPSASDVRTLAKADLVIAAGVGLETYLERIALNANVGSHLFKVGDTLPDLIPATHDDREDHHGHSHEGEYDPHWWHSIDLTIVAAEHICTEFKKLRPEAADTFDRNTKAYVQRMNELKTWAEKEVSRLPAAQRQLVTSHDAFGYLARDYGFTVHPIAGLSTESEADARQLVELVKWIRKEHVKALFPEASANPAVLQNLVRETGAKLGGQLFADGLGPIGSDADSYEAMMRHNLSAIVSALE